MAARTECSLLQQRSSTRDEKEPHFASHTAASNGASSNNGGSASAADRSSSIWRACENGCVAADCDTVLQLRGSTCMHAARDVASDHPDWPENGKCMWVYVSVWTRARRRETPWIRDSPCFAALWKFGETPTPDSYLFLRARIIRSYYNCTSTPNNLPGSEN